MPQGIIDVFEVIQIEKHHSGPPSASPSKRDGLANPVAKEQSIGQPGERIMFGQMSHPLRLCPRRAHVAKNDHRSGDFPFTVVDGATESSMKTS